MANKRQKPTKSYVTEDVAFIFGNYANMTAAEIAEARNLAPFQVNQIIGGLRRAGAKLPLKTHRDIIGDFVSTLKPNQKVKKTETASK